MSSRNRRLNTLKRFDKQYRSGRTQSAVTSTSKLDLILTSREVDTPTGSVPSATGTPAPPSSGSGQALSTGRPSSPLDELISTMTTAAGQWDMEVLGRLTQEASRPLYQFNMLMAQRTLEGERLRRREQEIEAEQMWYERQLAQARNLSGRHPGHIPARLMYHELIQDPAHLHTRIARLPEIEGQNARGTAPQVRVQYQAPWSHQAQSQALDHTMDAVRYYQQVDRQPIPASLLQEVPRQRRSPVMGRLMEWFRRDQNSPDSTT